MAFAPSEAHDVPAAAGTVAGDIPELTYLQVAAPKQGERTIVTTRTEPARTAQHERSLRLACLCAKVCDDFRGQNTAVLDLTEVTPIFDYFVITTAASRRQMQAIAEETSRAMKEDGERSRRGVEGADSSTWILQDYGDVVVHVFAPEARALYDLEHLWADARRVEWQPEAERLLAAT